MEEGPEGESVGSFLFQQCFTYAYGTWMSKVHPKWIGEKSLKSVNTTIMTLHHA